VPRSGPFDWNATGRADGLGFDAIRALGDGRAVFTARHDKSPTGRGALICRIGPAEGSRTPELPKAPPASLAPGTMAPYQYITDSVPILGSVVVTDKGVPYWAIGSGPVSGPDAELFANTLPGFVPEACGGNPAGDKLRLVDLSLQAGTGRVLALLDPQKYHPDDYVKLPQDCGGDKLWGPQLLALEPGKSEPLSNTLVGPYPCLPWNHPSAQPFKNCGNGKCDSSDKIGCPSECGADTCGDDTCDAWEQLHCPLDCKPDKPGTPWGGTCGNGKCDDQNYEPIFCPGDCPPTLPTCPDKLKRRFERPLALVPPSRVLTMRGVYDIPHTDKQSLPPLVLPADARAITGREDGEVIYARGGWIRRHKGIEPDPCHRKEPTESANCYPAPDNAGVRRLRVSERTGHVYALLAGSAGIVRRPIEAEKSGWEPVVTKLLSPVDFWLQDTADTTRLFILDGDLWVAVPGEKLPLVKRW